MMSRSLALLFILCQRTKVDSNTATLSTRPKNLVWLGGTLLYLLRGREDALSYSSSFYAMLKQNSRLPNLLSNKYSHVMTAGVTKGHARNRSQEKGVSRLYLLALQRQWPLVNGSTSVVFESIFCPSCTDEISEWSRKSLRSFSE